MEKVILDEGLWYIKNFLTQEELDLLKPYCDDTDNWYVTMRSPYKNILNKFPSSVPEFDEDGTLAIPRSDSPVVSEVANIFSKEGGIWERLESVLPEGYGRNSGIQTFKYCTDEDIERDRNKESTPTAEIDYAMQWHSEDGGTLGNRTASHSIYLNDDFEGGYVEFKKGYLIKPEAGMLVNIPIGQEFEHRVTKVLGPNSRHTLYGQCWSNLNIPISTKDDC
jgi:hypothetical protein